MDERLIKRYVYLAFQHNKKRIRKKYRYKLFEMMHSQILQAEKQSVVEIINKLSFTDVIIKLKYGGFNYD